MMLPLFDTNWIPVRDGHPAVMKLYNRHYSKYHYKDGRITDRCVGPGERIVLITPEWNALFIWRKFRSMDNQEGINCAVFRNESKIQSSQLILDAETFARKRWPGERLYTYVNPRMIRSANPGYCFKAVGWRKCGITKSRKLLILEKTVAI